MQILDIERTFHGLVPLAYLPAAPELSGDQLAQLQRRGRWWWMTRV
ncbi:hypothetical protein [Pseudomonas paeninsulae]|nr:hypothetical protein [Pseudomonas sp. IT1137]